ncbi:MAG: hypothetical protein GC185_04980 [Alphaproteobacteria bacterium]|nr:hypothetical protein [Alphaproteobacteria bacterium]
MAYVFMGKARMNTAISRGEIDKMSALLSRGLNIELTDDYGDSFLINAIYANNPRAVALLLEKGASTVTSAVRHGSPLLLAAQKGNLEICEKLVEKDPALLTLRDRDGNTPLHKAAESGHEEVAAFLLHKGVDPHAKNKANRTPLFLAQSKNNFNVASILEALPKPPTAYAVPQAAETAQPETETGWRKLADDCVAHVKDAPAIGYRITEIFNFAARERVTLYRNLETGAESVDVKDFARIAQKAPLERALAELQKRGGHAGADCITGIDKPRTLPPGPAAPGG